MSTIAGEGHSTKLVTIGDKGRSQLMRTESSLFAMTIAETYKVRVTFAQVRGPSQPGKARGSTCSSGSSRGSGRCSGGASTTA